MNKNKYGVPYHGYTLELADGREIVMDVGCEEDWGNVQQMFKDDGCGTLISTVGWGNDSDGHSEIVDVFDCESEDHLFPLTWATEDVWKYVDNYSC